MTMDTSKPHLGRIYDFMLGGHHNYEVDRQAAAQILKVAPTYPKWARANRWFLQFVAAEWAAAGRERVLDLATGLPTKGHFNDMMPAARILFTDNDPLSVTYGGDLLAGNPNMRYRLADVGKPETIVAQAEEFFAADRLVAVSCIGIAYLVPDAVLSAVLKALHAWSAPGSLQIASVPPGAVVTLERYTPDDQGRQIPSVVRKFDTTAAEAVETEPGSYRLIFQLPGYETVYYPLSVRRGEVLPITVTLPREDTLPPGYIPINGGPPPPGWYDQPPADPAAPPTPVVPAPPG